jgi:hypothetical protein
VGVAALGLLVVMGAWAGLSQLNSDRTTPETEPALQPIATVTVRGTEEWGAEAVPCTAGKELHLVASGEILQQRTDETSSVDAYGYEGTRGFAGRFDAGLGLHPGGLVVGSGPGDESPVGFEENLTLDYTCSGPFFFGINDLDVSDNRGDFTVDVYERPPDGEG